MAINPQVVVGGCSYYWYAVRESWPMGGKRKLEVLSRRMATERDAKEWADFCKSQAKRAVGHHKYTAILMEDDAT